MGIDERRVQACMPKQLLQRNDIPVLHLEDRREGMPRSFATDVLLDARLATYLLQHAVNFLVRRQARDVPQRYRYRDTVSKILSVLSAPENGCFI